MKLTKKEMISELARRSGITQHEAQTHIQNLMELFAETLIAGDAITYKGLFSLRFREIQQRGKGRLGNGASVPTSYYRLVAQSSQSLREARRDCPN